MNVNVVEILIGVATIVISLVGALIAGSFRAGRMSQRIDTLEKQMPGLATKDDIHDLKERIAEIRGMFRLTLNDPSGGK